MSCCDTLMPWQPTPTEPEAFFCGEYIIDCWWIDSKGGNHIIKSNELTAKNVALSAQQVRLFTYPRANCGWSVLSGKETGYVEPTSGEETFFHPKQPGSVTIQAHIKADCYCEITLTFL